MCIGGVTNHFDFMRKRILRKHNLEKLFAARKITLNEYQLCQM